MTRTYLVTGAASGMGSLTKARLETAGARVIGVDLHSADVIANLATHEGRGAMVEAVSREVDALDAVIACAGVAWTGASEATEKLIARSSPEMAIRVNYFGAVATCEGLRPLLARSASPRVAVVSSTAVLRPNPIHAVETCLAGDEERAVGLAQADSKAAYGVSKLALARWVRREAPKPDWAGAGIALNAVAPTVTRTPMGAPLLENSPAGGWPMPLHGPIAEPDDVAAALIWLTSPEARIVTGQVLFVDGGWDAVARGDDIF